MATWRLVRAAERAGVERFVFFSTLGASTRSRARLMRAKAIAERAVMEASLKHTVSPPRSSTRPGIPTCGCSSGCRCSR
jgi:NADH dehydrogenase